MGYRGKPYLARITLLSLEQMEFGSSGAGHTSTGSVPPDNSSWKVPSYPSVGRNMERPQLKQLSTLPLETGHSVSDTAPIAKLVS
jgi:hypothetical protein